MISTIMHIKGDPIEIKMFEIRLSDKKKPKLILDVKIYGLKDMYVGVQIKTRVESVVYTSIIIKESNGFLNHIANTIKSIPINEIVTQRVKKDIMSIKITVYSQIASPLQLKLVIAPNSSVLKRNITTMLTNTYTNTHIRILTQSDRSHCRLVL